MSITRNLLAGLGGAIALNIIHEGLKRRSSNMPRVDLVGEEALQKGLNYFGTAITDEDNLYYSTLVADIISNGIYYSFVGLGNPKYVWLRAAALGIAGGVGAVALPKPLGLNPEPVTKSTQVKTLTIAYYLAGALVAGGLAQALDKDK